MVLEWIVVDVVVYFVDLFVSMIILYIYQVNFVCLGCLVWFFGMNYFVVIFGGLFVQGDDFFLELLCVG